MKIVSFLTAFLMSFYAAATVVEMPDGTTEDVYRKRVGVFHLTKSFPIDDILTNLNKGNIGEKVSRKLYEALGFTWAGESKVGSNNGIDLIMLRSDGRAFLHEAKYAADGGVHLSSPDQCSRNWCGRKLQEMRDYSETTETTAGRVSGDYWRTLSVLEPAGELDVALESLTLLAIDDDTHSVLSTTESVIGGIAESRSLEFYAALKTPCVLSFYVFSTTEDMMNRKCDKLKALFSSHAPQLAAAGFNFEGDL